MARIAVVTYGGGHVAMMIPVIHALQKQGHEVVVLGLTTASRVLHSNAIQHVGFKELLPLIPEPESAIELGVRLVGNNDSSGPVSYDESVAYMGLSYWDLQKYVGPKLAAEKYSELGRQSFLPTQVLRLWLESVEPDLVVATNSPRAEQASILAAGSLGIPSL